MTKGLSIITLNRTTVYVSKLGSDSYPGTIEYPKLTVQAGIDRANLIDIGTIKIAQGTYSENLNINSFLITSSGTLDIYGGFSDNFSLNNSGQYTRTNNWNITLYETIITSNSGNTIYAHNINTSSKTINFYRFTILSGGSLDDDRPIYCFNNIADLYLKFTNCIISNLSKNNKLSIWNNKSYLMLGECQIYGNISSVGDVTYNGYCSIEFSNINCSSTSAAISFSYQNNAYVNHNYIYSLNYDCIRFGVGGSQLINYSKIYNNFIITKSVSSAAIIINCNIGYYIKILALF